MATIRTSIQIHNGMTPALQGMSNALDIVLSSFESLQQTSSTAIDTASIQAARNELTQAEVAFNNIEHEIRQADVAQQQLNNNINTSNNSANGLLNTFKDLALSMGIAFSAGKIVDLSDTMTSIEARLGLIVDEMNTVDELQRKIFQSAEDARGSYLATANAVSKLGLQARKAFSSNDELIAFTEQLNKTFVIAGTEAQGVSSVMLQLTQAMAAGKLQGEELNAVLDNAQPIVENISNYLEEIIGIDASNIKKLASEGVITAEVIKNAMFYAVDETNAEFASMPTTWGQVWNSIVNRTIMYSQPLLSFINALANNWSIIEPIVLGVVSAILIYLAVTKGAALVTSVFSAVQTFLSIGFGILAGNTAAASAAMYTYNSALLASPITWVVLAVIALIAVFYAAIAAVNKFTGTSLSATGIIVGAIAVAGAFIWNTVVGVINATIQYLWTRFVEPFISIIEWVLNVANGGFNSFGDAVANLIGNIISWFLSLGKVVTVIIDSIFGTDWTSGLSSLQDSVLAWGKNDNAITLDRNAPTIDARIEYGDAYNKGYDWGENLAGKMSLSNSNGIDYDNIMAGIGDISANTKGIKDSLEISEEDLKYMRDLAEREVIDRTVLRDVKLEVSNSFGDVRETADVDGIITEIEDRLAGAMESGAEGDWDV